MVGSGRKSQRDVWGGGGGGGGRYRGGEENERDVWGWGGVQGGVGEVSSHATITVGDNGN